MGVVQGMDLEVHQESQTQMSPSPITNDGSSTSKDVHFYGPWTLVQNKRNGKNGFSKQRDMNSRINEYKKNSTSKTGSSRALNSGGSRFIRDKQLFQADKGINDAHLASQNTAIIKDKNIPAVNKETQDTAVHLANMFQHLEKEGDSATTFNHSKSISTTTVIQDNTLLSVNTNQLLPSSTSILPSEASFTSQQNGKSQQPEIDMHGDESNLKILPEKGQSKLDTEGAHAFSQHAEGTNSGGDTAGSMSDQPTSDVELVSAAATDQCMQDADWSGADGIGSQKCTVLGGAVAKTGGDGDNRTTAMIGVATEVVAGEAVLPMDGHVFGFQPTQYASSYTNSSAKRTADSSLAIRNSRTRFGAGRSPYGNERD